MCTTTMAPGRQQKPTTDGRPDRQTDSRQTNSQIRSRHKRSSSRSYMVCHRQLKVALTRCLLRLEIRRCGCWAFQHPHNHRAQHNTSVHYMLCIADGYYADHRRSACCALAMSWRNRTGGTRERHHKIHIILLSYYTHKSSRHTILLFKRF